MTGLTVKLKFCFAGILIMIASELLGPQMLGGKSVVARRLGLALVTNKRGVAIQVHGNFKPDSRTSAVISIQSNQSGNVGSGASSQLAGGQSSGSFTANHIPGDAADANVTQLDPPNIVLLNPSFMNVIAPSALAIVSILDKDGKLRLRQMGYFTEELGEFSSGDSLRGTDGSFLNQTPMPTEIPTTILSSVTIEPTLIPTGVNNQLQPEETNPETFATVVEWLKTQTPESVLAPTAVPSSLPFVTTQAPLLATQTVTPTESLPAPATASAQPSSSFPTAPATKNAPNIPQTPTLTWTPFPSNTSTAVPTLATDTPTAVATRTPVPTATRELLVLRPPVELTLWVTTPTETKTPAPTLASTLTEVPSPSPTEQASPSPTPSSTKEFVSSPTPSATASLLPSTFTPTASVTIKPTSTPSTTETPTTRPTVELPTLTPSETPWPTVELPTPTPDSGTPLWTATPTATETEIVIVRPTYTAVPTPQAQVTILPYGSVP